MKYRVILFFVFFAFGVYKSSAGVWTAEDANTIRTYPKTSKNVTYGLENANNEGFGMACTINSEVFDAYCDKVTGLCDFYNKSGHKLFEDAGDIYIGIWEGQKEFSYLQEQFDENSVSRRFYAVSSSNLSEDGNTARVTFTQIKSGQIQFNTIYTFHRDNPRVLVNCGVTYLAEMDITNEIIKTAAPDAFTVSVIEPFDQAELVNDIQIDNMDDIAGWFDGGDGEVTIELNTDPNFIKEGSGSVKVVFTNDGDENINEMTGMMKSFIPADYPDKTHLSFWLYPTRDIWFYVKIYSTNGNPETRTIRFPANEWSLFQWDFKRSFGLDGLTGFNKILIRACEKYLGAQSIAVYIDDIRLSSDMKAGLMSSISQGDGIDNWYGSGSRTIDGSFPSLLQGCLKWSNLNVSTGDQTLFQYTVNKDVKANPDLPTDISNYDYLVFDVYATKDIDVGFMIEDSDGNSIYTVFDVPIGGWQTIKWDFKNHYRGKAINHSLVKLYRFYMPAKYEVTNCTVWFDNLRLVKLDDNCPIFDGFKARYERDGKAVKYSPRVFKMNDSVFIYGDNFGAKNIEYVTKNPASRTIDCYIHKVDMHTLRTNINRDGNVYGATYYKETTRYPADVSEGTIVYDFNGADLPEINKSRWPRNFKAAYSISEDDFYFKSQEPFYCGTSDILSPDYAKKGIIGHNLRTTNNLWYYLPCGDGGGVYKDNMDIKNFFDLLYNSGIEIAIHTPGNGADDRDKSVESLDDLVANYNVRNWVDHSDNPEDFYRKGAFTFVNGTPNDGNDGYYMLDLLKERNFTYIWPISNPMTGTGTSNLFYDRYKETWPLPHRNQIIDNSSGQIIYLYGRTWGDGYYEFISRGGGGNIAELQEIIEDNGLVFVFTHLASSQSLYHDEVGEHRVLKDDVENIFSWLETKQDQGQLWVDTVSNILDWMINLENVEITNLTATSVTVWNNNSFDLSGISLMQEMSHQPLMF
ncbi:MAG: hypothetical protein CVV39_01315 [Planctomycetes bacterium HGW-Planctomycetes-1]|nr:MAG: hypothetical protein CVV39_01315 [Planctomycetes bacterium HGW-Planctomycetes-1]